MQTATIRISAPAHSLLREMARKEKKPMQAIIDQALEAYRRQRFLDGLGADFATLREDAAEWTRVEAERTEWDKTLADGEDA